MLAIWRPVETQNFASLQSGWIGTSALYLSNLCWFGWCCGRDLGRKSGEKKKNLEKRELRCCVVQKMVLSLQPISRHMSCWPRCSCVSQVKSVTLDRWNFDVKAMMLSAWQSSVGRYKTSETPNCCSTLWCRWASHTGGDERPLHDWMSTPGVLCCACVFLCTGGHVAVESSIERM